MSLEFRHIASYLIWYSGHHLYEDLLHEVILCVGYFTVLHPDNQVGCLVGSFVWVFLSVCLVCLTFIQLPSALLKKVSESVFVPVFALI